MRDWDEMPWLVARKQVIRVTGLSAQDLRKLVAAGVLHRHATGRKGRYFKMELMQMCRVSGAGHAPTKQGAIVADKGGLETGVLRSGPNVRL